MCVCGGKKEEPNHAGNAWNSRAKDITILPHSPLTGDKATPYTCPNADAEARAGGAVPDVLPEPARVSTLLPAVVKSTRRTEYSSATKSRLESLVIVMPAGVNWGVQCGIFKP